MKNSQAKITKEMLEGVKQGKSYFLNPFDIVVDKDVNPRLDFGQDEDWSVFKESIRDYGVQQNIKVYFNETDKKYHLSHGFRRMRAIHELRDQDDYIVESVSVDIIEDDKKLSIIGHFIFNNGKSLTDPEMAEGLLRLKKLTTEDKVSELARMVGISYQKAHTLMNYAENASAQVKRHVQKGDLSFSGATQIIKKSGSGREQNMLVKEGEALAKENGSTKIKTQQIPKLANDKVSLEVKIGNLIAEANKTPDVDKEALNMFSAIIRALNQNQETKEIVHLFNLQTA